MQDPRVRVRAFDLGIHWYSPHVTGFFDAALDAGRVEVVFGDSQQTLPAFAAAFNSTEPPEFCDLIFVDGDHHFDAALADLRNLRAAARPGHHVLLMDDPDHDEVGRAWRAVLADGTTSTSATSTRTRMALLCMAPRRQPRRFMGPRRWCLRRRLARGEPARVGPAAA